MKWLDKKLNTGILSKKRNLLVIWTTVLVFIFCFPSRTIVRFGYQELSGLAEQAVLKLGRTGLFSWGQTFDRLLNSGAFHSKAASILKLWAAWGGTFAVLVPLLLFIALNLIIKFKERQTKPPVLPSEDLALFRKIKKEVIKLYFRANRINYIVVASIVLGIGIILSLLQAALQVYLSTMLISTSIGTYILYSGILYFYFLFYKGFSKQEIISTIDHYIGLQHGLSTTLAVDFEQSQSSMYHLLLGAISENFQHTRLTRLFPWRFPQLNAKNFLANVTAVTFTFVLAQASIPALANIAQKAARPAFRSGLSMPLLLDNSPFSESVKAKDLKYQLAQESLIIENLSQEILKQDDSPLTRSLAEELMKLAADLSHIAMEMDNFPTSDEFSIKLKGRLSSAGFIHDRISQGDQEANPEADSLDTSLEYKEPVVTKNAHASNIKKTTAILASQVDQLIKELLVYKIRHYNKKNQIPSLKTGNNSTPASVREPVPKKTKKELIQFNYKKWKDSLKLKKMAVNLNKISQNLMAALVTDRQPQPSDRQFRASSSSPANKTASLTKGSKKYPAGNKIQPARKKNSAFTNTETASSSKKPYKDERILISHKKLKLVKSELEEAELLLKDWSNEWRQEPRISETIRVSGSRIRELNKQVVKIIELQEVYLEGGKIPENIRPDSVPQKLVTSDKNLLTPPKEVFQKMAGELGKISRKIFRTGENLGSLPSKASDIDVVHNLGSSVPPLAQNLRKQPKTVDRLIKELGKISNNLRNWGLAGNPALFNPDSQNKLVLKELSKKLKEIASKSQARKLGKELGRVAERFQDSRLPEIAIPPKGLDKLSPSLTKVALKSQARRFKQKSSPPENRLLADQVPFEGIPKNYSPPPGVNPSNKNRAGPAPNQLLSRLYIEQTANNNAKQAGGRGNQEWFRPQTVDLVPADYAGGLKGTPPRQLREGTASKNTSNRRSRGNSKTELAKIDFQPTGQLRNQNIRELERIRKNSTLTGIRKGRLGSGGDLPHDPEIIEELRKRYGAHQQPAEILSQGKTQVFGNKSGVSLADIDRKTVNLAEAQPGGKPGVFRKLKQNINSGAGLSGMMGSNKWGMKEKPLAGQQSAEQLRSASPERSQPKSTPEMTPLQGDRGSGKGRGEIDKRGRGRLTQKRRSQNHSLPAGQAKIAANHPAGQSRPESINSALPGKGPHTEDINTSFLSGVESLSNLNTNILPKDMADSKVSRISQAESLSKDIKHRQSLGNRNDLRNLLSPGSRSLKNRQLGITNPPNQLPSRNEQNLTSISKQPVPSILAHQETIPNRNRQPAEGSVNAAALLNRLPDMKVKAELPAQAGRIDTTRLSADLQRFKQKVSRLNKRLKNAQTLSQIKELSQKIADEFSEFRSSQLGKSQPPELLAKQDRSFHKLASLNFQIQSMPTDIRQETARKNFSNFENRLVSKAARMNNPDLEKAIAHQDFPKVRSPSLKKLTDEMAETATGLLSKTDRGMFSHRPSAFRLKPKTAGSNQSNIKTPPARPPIKRADQEGIKQALSNGKIPELKKITRKMSKIASQLLGKTDPERLPAQARRLADLSKRLGHYQELGEKPPKRLPSELNKSIKTLRNLSNKLTDNLIKDYRPGETNLLAKQILNQTRQVTDYLTESIAQPKSPAAREDQAKLAKLKQNGTPNKLERFKLEKRFQETSTVIKYGSKLTDFNPAAGKRGSRISKDDLIKRIKKLSKTMEREQDPVKIRKLSNRLSQLAELLSQSNQTPMGNGQTAGKTGTATVSKLPNQQMADRVDLLSDQLQNLGATSDMNRLKAEFDRLSNHMRTLPKMIYSQKGDQGLSDNRSGSSSRIANSRKGKKKDLPMQAAMEKRMQDKITAILGRMDRFIDKMTNFYNQKLAKERSANSYEKAVSKRTDRGISKDTNSFSKEGPIRNTLSMETDLASPETFQRIIKRLRSQRKNISKLKMKLPVFRNRKPTYSLRNKKRVSTKQPTGLKEIRLSSFGESFPGIRAPKPTPSVGSNLNRRYMIKDNEHYQKVEINIKDSLKEQARLLPRRSLKAEGQPPGLELSKEQTLDHSTLTQDVPPAYQNIIKTIFIEDKKPPFPAAHPKK